MIPILNNHCLDEIETTGCKGFVQSLWYATLLQYGVKKPLTKLQSCNPVQEPLPADTLVECDENSIPELLTAEISALGADNQETLRLRELRKVAQTDKEYQQLKKIILQGFPDNHNQLPDICKKYWQVCQHPSVDDYFIMHGCYLLIPEIMQMNVLI